jgi:hypothetical protein
MRVYRAVAYQYISYCSAYCCMHYPATVYLPRNCLRGNMFNDPFPSNGYTHYNILLVISFHFNDNFEFLGRTDSQLSFRYTLSISYDNDCIETTKSTSFSTIACVFIAVGTRLSIRSLAKDWEYFTESFPSNDGEGGQIVNWFQYLSFIFPPN